MSTTAIQALAAIKAQLATGLGFSVYWQGDDPPTLSDTPAAFAFIVFDNEGSGGRPTAFGGGRGNNLYRSQARVEAYVFSPLGEGADIVLGYAETIAARLRSYRDSDISCFAADVILIGPGSALSVPGLASEVNSYQCAVAEVSLSFDQIG